MRSSGSRIGRYDLSRPQDLGLLACERPAQGLQAECRGHGRVQKNFAERVAEIRAQLAPDTPVEVWFQDEMRDAGGPKEQAHLSLGQEGFTPPCRPRSKDPIDLPVRCGLPRTRSRRRPRAAGRGSRRSLNLRIGIKSTRNENVVLFFGIST